jgi:hypothetical protein
MHKLISLLFILSICGFSATANESLYYDHVLDADGDDYVADLNLNPIVIQNRAACAAASTSPAESAFTIVNAELVGQTAYRIYQNTDKKISENYYKVYALKEFRLRLARLSEQIHDLLLSGRLPIIPDDLEKVKQFPVLYRLLQDCPDWNCRELDNYIANVGNYFVNGNESSGPEIDRFLRIGQLKLSTAPKTYQCYYLKKFSPLQANLFADTPGVDVLNAMGQAYDKQQALVTECIDPNPVLSNAYYAMQSEFKITDKEKFERNGFDYWHSFKIYLQAWWRLNYSIPTIVEGDNKATLDWFRELDLTSILMITPNSCKSIEKPACDNSFLAINSLRKLSALDQDKMYRLPVDGSSRHSTDHTEILPSGPQADLVRDQKPAVNTDIAGIRSQDDAREWLKNFYTNISKRKAMYNARLWEAVNIYNLFLTQLSNERFDQELEKEFNEAKRTKNFSAFYYMCTEYAVANTDYLSDMDGQQQHLQKLTSLQKIHPLLDADKLGQIATYYSATSKKIASICNYLTKREVFDGQGFSSNYAYFRPWFLDYMQFYNVRPISLYDPNQESLIEQNGFDLLPNAMKHKCSKASDCARLALEASVNLHSVATYAEAFFKTQSELLSPDLFNPYSERVACNTYDPWKRKRNSIKLLGLDLINVALFSWNPSPLLIAFDITEGQVVNFDKLINDGKIQYTANMTKDKLRTSLIARLGPINGSACQIVIGSVPLNAGEVYPGAFGFLGMNIAYNHTRVKSEQSAFEGVNLPKDKANISLLDSNSKTFGIGCQLFFTPLSKKEYSQLQDRDFSPVKFAVTLFRSIFNFISYRKHPDVPQAASYDINQVYESYKVNDGVPKKCVKKLAQQKRCFDNRCEQATVDFMEATFGGKVRRYYYDQWTKKTVVHMSSCDGFYEIDSRQAGCISSRDQKNYLEKIKAFGSCKL